MCNSSDKYICTCCTYISNFLNFQFLSLPSAQIHTTIVNFNQLISLNDSIHFISITHRMIVLYSICILATALTLPYQKCTSKKKPHRKSHCFYFGLLVFFFIVFILRPTHIRAFRIYIFIKIEKIKEKLIFYYQRKHNNNKKAFPFDVVEKYIKT